MEFAPRPCSAPLSPKIVPDPLLVKPSDALPSRARVPSTICELVLSARLLRPLCLLLVMGVAHLCAGRVIGQGFLEPGWPDECIYLVGARNLAERGSLDTSFYLTHSLLRLGHPHRDVHMPGYVMALSLLVGPLGASSTTAATLNHGLFLLASAATFGIALGLLGDLFLATCAGLLFSLLPPLLAYLPVAYAEVLVTTSLLLPLVVSFRARSLPLAALAGVLFGLGPLVRETLILALPMHVARLGRRELVRGFLPAAVLTLGLVVSPFSRGRAIHPNALFPSLLTEAVRSDSPVATFAGAVANNVALNLRQAAEARPLQNVEDLLLVWLAALALAATWGSKSLGQPEARRFGRATLASVALVLAAVLCVYVLRARGGVLGGVRAFLPWSAPLLILALAPLRSFRSTAQRLAVVVGLSAVAAGFWLIDQRQIQLFDHARAVDHEDQSRLSALLRRETDSARPHRVLAKAFLFGFERWPTEVIWSLPGDSAELKALEQSVSFDLVAVHVKLDQQRLLFARNPRYLRLDREDPDPEYLLWRRLY